jgi:copper(I)-binding protein
VKRILISVLAIVFLLSACSADPGMDVYDAWMRPAKQGENGAIYFMIHNYSSEPDELLEVSSDVAEAIEIHETKMNGDVMEMHQLESVSLDGITEFAPGKLHLMLVNLKKDINLGEEIEITLHFKNYPDLRVFVPVQDTPAHEENH